MVSLRKPLAVLLSVWTGVGGCGWPSWRSALRSGSESWQLMKMAPISASAAEDMTFLIIEEIVWIGPLEKGVVELDK